MMERARPTRFFIPPLKLSGILSFWPSISMTAIIGDELAGTRLVLVEGFGDGGASIIATHNSQLSTCNSQPRTLSGSNCHVALLVSRRINDVEQHREKEIANQNRERGVHYGFGGRTAHADGAFARAQSLLATDEYNQNPKTKCFREAHDNVAIARPAHHVRHVVSAVNVEHENRNEIAGSDADGDAFGYQQRHGYHHGEYTRHHQIIGWIHREGAKGIDLLGHFHCADFGRHGRADAARYHQCCEHRAKLATDRDRYYCACGRSHADLIKLKERLSREHRAGKRPRDHDNQLGEQSDLDNLVKK